MKAKNKIIMLLMIAAMTAVSCGRPTAEQSNKKEKEKIVLWTYFETDAQLKALDELMEGYNLFQDEYEASYEYVPMTEFSKKLTMAYTEKALPDLALIDNPDMPLCIKMGMFEDITEFLEELQIEEEYYPSLIQTVTYEDRMYGMPFDCNNVALIYNKGMLEEQNIKPPATWEELEEAAAILTKDTRSGFLMSAVGGEQGAFQMLPWILSAGEAANEIGGEKTQTAFAFINNLVEQGYMTKNCINLSQTDVARVFIQGEAAMMENGPWVFPMLNEAGIQYGVVPLPIKEKSSVIVGGENLGILKGKNIKGAKTFLAYCNQDEVLKKFCKATGVLSPKVNTDLEGQPHMEAFREQMEGAVVRTSIPSWNNLSVQLSASLYQMVAGEKTPEQAALALKSED